MSAKMLSWNVCVVVVVLSVNWLSGAALGVQYDVINLGTFSALGGPTSAHAINDSGKVVGAASTNGSAIQHAFLWTPGGTDGVSFNPQMKDLGTLGGLFSFAYGINNLGQVVGASETENEFEMHAFLWTPGGTDGVAGNPQMKDLGALDGGFSNAYDINNVNSNPAQSQVSGVSSATSQNAFLWTPGATDGSTSNPQMKGLSTLGHLDSIGWGINDSGQVAGASFSGSIDSSAFLWTPGGTDGVGFNPQMKDLGALIGGGWSAGGDINNLGQVVGEAEIANGETRAFLWTPGGTDGAPINPQMKALTAPANTRSVGLGINEISQVVGVVTGLNQNDQQHAFSWTASTGMTDLNSLFTYEFNWIWSKANDVNESGWIIGEGGQGAGNPSAFVLKPITFSVADFNQDGYVDGADLSAFLGYWGTIYAPPGGLGDFNVDGNVDGADFSFFLGEWTGGPPGLSIPEPASAALLVFAGAVMIARRRI